MRSILPDVRRAVRVLLRDRGFSMVAILALVLGIGVNVAIFSVVNGVLLTPLPYAEPDRVVRLYQSMPERGLTFFSVAPSDFLDWRAQAQSFTSMAAFASPRNMALTSTTEPEMVAVARVSAEIFRLLGVAPSRGRLFDRGEEENEARVLIVSRAFASAHLGDQQDGVGQSVMLDGERYAIVGVMPPDFTIPGSPAEVWTPLTFTQSELSRGNRFLRVLARLKPGVSPEAAQSELAVEIHGGPAVSGARDRYDHLQRRCRAAHAGRGRSLRHPRPPGLPGRSCARAQG